jgi:hypothetical protein
MKEKHFIDEIDKFSLKNVSFWVSDHQPNNPLTSLSSPRCECDWWCVCVCVCVIVGVCERMCT